MMRNRRISLSALFLGICLVGTLIDIQAEKKDRNLPAGFEQIVPRGAIASVDDPVFVAADKAEISPDSWVLGVLIEGNARAYSLNLLNHHEVVNDRIGDRPVAAVW